MFRSIALALLTVSSFWFLGCGSQAATTQGTVSAPDARYVLQAEPEGAIGVVDFREHAKSGEPVTVVGRVGGGIDPWIKGRAAFMLVDTGAPMPTADDTCGPECQHCAQEIAASTTVVKFVDQQGKTLSIDSRELLGIKEEETIVVRGIANRDASGNVALTADSVYVKR